VIEELQQLDLPNELRALRRDQWAEVIDYAEVNGNRFSVKGLLAEQLNELNREFGPLFERIRRRLQSDPRWDLSTLQYVRRAKGKAPTRISGGSYQDLADGLIVVFAKDPRARQQVFICGVLESKSLSNKGDLISRGGEELGQLGWNFERIRENPIELEYTTVTNARERRIFAPDAVDISRNDTAWVAVLPRGVNLKPDEINRLRATLNLEPQWNHAVDDKRLQRIADEIVRRRGLSSLTRTQ
jgi:hypothetical protein